MRQALLITAAVICVVSVIAGFFTLTQANREQADLTAPLKARAQLLAQNLSQSIALSLQPAATSSAESIINSFTKNENIAGVGVFDARGNPVALSSGFPADLERVPIIPASIARGAPEDAFREENGTNMYAFAEPILFQGSAVGTLVIVQDAQYISDAVRDIWRDDLVRLVLQILFFSGAIMLLVYGVFSRAVHEMAESIRSVRAGNPLQVQLSGMDMLQPISSEIMKMSTSLRQARRAASEEARMRLEKIDSPWTADRLKEFIKAYVKDRPIFVVSNGEPYVHDNLRNPGEWSIPAGGVITALEPIMEACGGTWIACGSGAADKKTADENGMLRVPPEEPRYVLKRIFLSAKDTTGYYAGFSNEALWPLCHLAHVRPQFRKEDWAAYRKVNGTFAKAVLEEVRHIERPIILIQDYHLALVAALIKKGKPDAQVAMFWHIPWPSAAQFAICPWRKEILEGMIGADLVGFHTQQYCNNFMETVAAEIEARIDYERFAVVSGGHETRVEPFPISIAFPGEAEITASPDPDALANLGIHAEYLALGVDRLDYIKGILERFRAVEFLLKAHPEYRERFTLLQIASPTRQAVEKYREYAQQVIAEADRINEEYGTRDWRPIVLEHRSYSHQNLRKLYQLARVCLVTSLHDGMNLVAKEYVAARGGENGVLILSKFTGAARDLPSALIVNPYNAEETSEAIHRALTMPESEQRRRMKVMRTAVSDYNVYRWSAEIIRELIRIG